ncbi:hypothetical protein GJ744_004338 [Endocarpon pusillum]|uniref:Uncharacterized protein n=1 Tax=Endocarpon pusillum TaxID=364733 RepID=A0A8H7A9J2_9EURO|nr:hypothetical protein GJ744_004338 [Endocarpon pusillum]
MANPDQILFGLRSRSGLANSLITWTPSWSGHAPAASSPHSKGPVSCSSAYFEFWHLGRTTLPLEFPLHQNPRFYDGMTRFVSGFIASGILSYYEFLLSFSAFEKEQACQHYHAESCASSRLTLSWWDGDLLHYEAEHWRLALKKVFKLYSQAGAGCQGICSSDPSNTVATK